MDKNIHCEQNVDLALDVSDDEIISLWKSIKSPISADEAWLATVAGEALDQLFARPTPKNFKVTWH